MGNLPLEYPPFPSYGLNEAQVKRVGENSRKGTK